MSRTNEEIASMVDIRADFDFWVSEKNWKEAWVAINAMGEFDPNEALRMHQELNCAKNDFVYIPIEDNDHPILTPEEDDLPNYTSKETAARFFGVSEETLEQLRLKEEQARDY